MFERYSEKAHRVISLARYEASNFGAPCIETQHILLGLLRDITFTNRFLPSINSLKLIHQKVRAVTPVREKISTAVDLPLSDESKRVLAYAAEEANLRKRKEVGTGHLSLALLREENCLAATLLRECGLAIGQVREELGTHRGEFCARDRLQSKLLAYLESLPNEIGILATPAGICVKADHSTAVAPFLVIEILSPSETLWDLRRRIEEQFATGLRYFWLFDPGSRHVFIATPDAGLQESKSNVLHTENPVLELPLTEVFA
jgi:hypothetical protein